MAKFSKGAFMAVAGILRLVMEETDPMPTISPKEVVLRCAGKIADIFERDNEAFDRHHFLAVVRGDRPVNSKPPSHAERAAGRAEDFIKVCTNSKCLANLYQYYKRCPHCGHKLIEPDPNPPA